jgi:hypothetical protein
MAYIRANDPETGKYRLLSANLDGSDEKVLYIASIKADIPRWLAGETSQRPNVLPENVRKLLRQRMAQRYHIRGFRASPRD